jgi:hypothetical protein
VVDPGLDRLLALTRALGPAALPPGLQAANVDPACGTNIISPG